MTATKNAVLEFLKNVLAKRRIKIPERSCVTTKPILRVVARFIPIESRRAPKAYGKGLKKLKIGVP
jgi:septum formation topological specificity factor MinE